MITSLSVPGSHLECAPRVFNGYRYDLLKWPVEFSYIWKPYGDIWAKLEKALEIWRGFGMSVQGVRTCGDYMFSGHTVTLTMLNFFITECKLKICHTKLVITFWNMYILISLLVFIFTKFVDTPRRLYFLHTFSWILNLFGVFFILAAREHYSIDVFVAFYITSRMFLWVSQVI